MRPLKRPAVNSVSGHCLFRLFNSTVETLFDSVWKFLKIRSAFNVKYDFIVCIKIRSASFIHFKYKETCNCLIEQKIKDEDVKVVTVRKPT